MNCSANRTSEKGDIDLCHLCFLGGGLDIKETSEVNSHAAECVFVLRSKFSGKSGDSGIEQLLSCVTV